MVFFLACVYGRLLNVIKDRPIPTTIKTNKLPIAGTKYISATDVEEDSNVVDATDFTWVSALNLRRVFISFLFLPENFGLEHSENGFSADSVVIAGRFGRKEKARVYIALMRKDVLHNFLWLGGKSEDLCPKANVGKSYYTYFPKGYLQKDP